MKKIGYGMKATACGKHCAKRFKKIVYIIYIQKLEKTSRRYRWQGGQCRRQKRRQSSTKQETAEQSRRQEHAVYRRKQQ